MEEVCVKSENHETGIEMNGEHALECLVCGQRLVSTVVKSEVILDDFSVRNPPHKRFTLMGLPWTEEEKLVFRAFFKWFQIKSRKFIWNHDSEPFPFCDACKQHSTSLLEMEHKIEELQAALKNAIVDLKEKLRQNEPEFRKNGVYQRDTRCFRLRRRILGFKISATAVKLSATQSDNGVVNNNQTTEKSCQGPSSRRRTSRRSVKPVERFGASQSYLDNLRTVKMPVEETKTAENVSSVEAGTSQVGDIGSVIMGNSIDVNDEDNQEDSASRNSAITVTSRLNPTGIQKRKMRPKTKVKVDEIEEQSMFNQETPNSKAKPKSTPSSSLTGCSKWEILEDHEDDPNGIEPESSDYSSDEEQPKKKKKRRRKKKEVDYNPDIAAASQVMEKEDMPDLAELKKERIHEGSETDIATFLHVSFKKLGGGKYQCLECNNGTVVIRGSVRKHTIRAHTKYYSCPECGHCEGALGELNKHIRFAHQGRYTKECDICGKPQSTLSGRMARHRATHYSEEELKAAIARGEKVPTWSDRKRGRNFQCDHCGKAFESSSYLKQHVVTKHADEAKLEGVELDNMLGEKELCPDCGRFFYKGYLKQHQIRSHTAKKQWSCSVCNKEFTRATELLRHKWAVHEKHYPFPCTICSKGYITNRQLQIHMNGHKNIRPFPCPHCPMAFFTNGNLTRHIGNYHVEGATPGRKTFVRGTEGERKKKLELRKDGVPYEPPFSIEQEQGAILIPPVDQPAAGNGSLMETHNESHVPGGPSTTQQDYNAWLGTPSASSTISASEPLIAFHTG